MFGVKEREKKPRKATVSFKKLLLIIECVQRKRANQCYYRCLCLDDAGGAEPI